MAVGANKVIQSERPTTWRRVVSGTANAFLTIAALTLLFGLANFLTVYTEWFYTDNNPHDLANQVGVFCYVEVYSQPWAAIYLAEEYDDDLPPIAKSPDMIILGHPLNWYLPILAWSLISAVLYFLGWRLIKAIPWVASVRLRMPRWLPLCIYLSLLVAYWGAIVYVLAEEAYGNAPGPVQ